jgi:FKBP-type peptidyl-prolyl cis-trans isomerase 2
MAIISFLYRGSLADGTVFDENTEAPHEITVGRSQVMPVLEQALVEMDVGEERVVDIAAADAYGEYLEDAIQSVPIHLIPNGEGIPEGETILWSSPRSPRPIPAKVLSTANKVAQLDFNHPLAGKDLIYWVKVVGKNT